MQNLLVKLVLLVMYQQMLLWLVIQCVPHKEWLKLSAYEHRLPEMVKL